MAVNEEWLARCGEQALEPDLPIIDPHHHMWVDPQHRPRERYTGEEHVARDMRTGHRIIGTVYVECGHRWLDSGPDHLRAVGETIAVNADANRCLALGAPVAAGIVGRANLEIGARVAETLAAHIEAAPARFRGIRQNLSWDSDERLRYWFYETYPYRSYDTKWREGFAQLGKLGLSFDSWAYSTQLRDVVELARSFPDTTIVINHMGGPLGVHAYAELETHRHVLDHWRRMLIELAACPNTVMKLGGLAMHCIGLHLGKEHRALPATSDELAELTGDLYRFAIDTFSPARCMFESNFPVDKEAIGAAVLWNSFKKVSAGYSAEERSDMFSRTAARVYRLDIDSLAAACRPA